MGLVQSKQKPAMLAGALAVGLFGVALTSHANAATTKLFSTGFESSDGYTSGTQLATNANWTGDLQDTTGWLITNATTNGGAESGSQWVIASSPTLTASGGGTPALFQWTVTPINDTSVVTGTAGVKLIAPTSGTVNRTSIGGVAMYDAATDEIAELDIVNDTENTFGAGAGYYIYQGFPTDGTANGTGYIYSLPTSLNTYYDLSISVDFSTGIVTDYVNGTALPQTGTTIETDFHDFDMLAERGSHTTGGTANRAGFDNYNVTDTTAVPEPVFGAFGLGAATLMGRRRRALSAR